MPDLIAQMAPQLRWALIAVFALLVVASTTIAILG